MAAREPGIASSHDSIKKQMKGASLECVLLEDRASKVRVIAVSSVL